MLLTLGVSAPLDFSVRGVGPGAGALPAVVAGGVPSALDADGTLGSPAVVLGGVAGAVDGLLSDGALVTGLAGASTFVSLVHAAIDIPIATAPTVMRHLRVNIVCSRIGWEVRGRAPRQGVAHDAVGTGSKIEAR